MPLNMVWIDKVSMISVDCFAIITGYFTFGTKKMRVKKYSYWLVLICLTTFLLYCSILLPLNLWDFNKVNVLGVLTFGTYNNWYLWAALGIYIFGPLISWGLERIKTSSQIGIMIFLIFFSIILMHINSKYYTSFANIFPGGGYSFIWLFICFFVGHTIRRTNLHNSWMYLSGLLSLSLFIYWYVGYSKNWWEIITSKILITDHLSLITLSMAVFVFSIFPGIYP